MATFLQPSASRNVKALNAHSHSPGTGVQVTISTGDASRLEKASEHMIVNNSTVVHESSIADPSIKIKFTSCETADYPVKTNVNPTGYDNTHVYDKPKHGYEHLFEKLKSGWDSIFHTGEQKPIIHRGNHSLGDALSQFPWMKPRLIDEPSIMDCVSSDIHLRTFIHQITGLTVSIVTKQCTDGIAILVGTLVANLTCSMEASIKLIVETIIEQLILDDSVTATCHNFNEIKEKIYYPRQHGHPKYGTYGGSD